jgi:hypothetical protein
MDSKALAKSSGLWFETFEIERFDALSLKHLELIQEFLFGIEQNQ